MKQENVTHTYGDKISVTFTNGILSTQNLVKQLSEVNKAPSMKIMSDAASADKTKRVEGTKKKEGASFLDGLCTPAHQ
jgi:hypothetical protein